MFRKSDFDSIYGHCSRTVLLFRRKVSDNGTTPGSNRNAAGNPARTMPPRPPLQRAVTDPSKRPAIPPRAVLQRMTSAGSYGSPTYPGFGNIVVAKRVSFFTDVIFLHISHEEILSEETGDPS